MKVTLLHSLALLCLSTSAFAQSFSHSRSVQSETRIEDDYYNEFTSVVDEQALDTSLDGDWDQEIEAEVTLGGSVTYADAGQWSWVDAATGDFDVEGLAAGGLYNQYNGEMHSSSSFSAEFLVPTAGSVQLSYDFGFGDTFDGLQSHDRPGISIAEVRVETNEGVVLFSRTSTFELGNIWESGLNIPLGPGSYRIVARAEIEDSTFFETVVGSMTVASFHVEGSVTGSIAAQTVISRDSFEHGFGSFVPRGAQCQLHLGIGEASSGRRSVKLQGASPSSSKLESRRTLQLASRGFSAVEIRFEYLARNFLPGDSVQLQFFDGTTWQSAASWEAGVNLVSGTHASASAIITNATHNFAENSKLRLECVTSNFRSLLYLDNIQVFGL